ncbi:hypothetical protein OJ997_20595 [Solirubrobacter phytolaccae]|uniref:Uncharacterized protein n=1 Tax=Solirubrobacter phytolaccae TaxID=1404360 RepID=A0A9X3NAA8_9ACTN|nr:hypothetical protein [Solirubrobacter phytolaccae]MDA0182723.1 hypothetical protein [Solirubrobacter phytolaccae]
MQIVGPSIALALVMLGLTAWRVRRRQYRELAESYAWIAFMTATLVAIVNWG